MGPYIVIKVLSNDIYKIRKVSSRYTKSLHRMRIRPYVFEQGITDVTVRSKEQLPNPDVKVSHNERLAVSWEMDFGKLIDEHETSQIPSNNQQTVTQNITNTNGENTIQKVTKNQTVNTNDLAPSSPGFSNLTTDAGDKPYIRHHPPIESPTICPNSLPTFVGYNSRKKAKYNLRPNP